MEGAAGKFSLSNFAFVRLEEPHGVDVGRNLGWHRLSSTQCVPTSPEFINFPQWYNNIMGLRLRLSIHLSGYRHHPRYRYIYIFFEKKYKMFFAVSDFFCTFAFGNDKAK
ncbi:MAG: hypothetical protein IJK94_03270 [Bacteroidaceae bacterium]|nr:hypothetical protein [Bacteroidaceae bacterium]